MANRSDYVKQIAAILGKDKAVALQAIEARVASRIEGLGGRCVSVTVGNAEHRFSEHPIDWTPRFLAFIRGKSSYQGSAITTPVVAVAVDAVVEELQKYCEQRTPEITETAVRYIVEDATIREALVTSITTNTIAKAATMGVTTIAGNRIRALIVPSIASTVGSLSGTVAGKMVLKQVALHSKVIVGHLLASKAFMAMLHGALTHALMAGVVAVTVHLAATVFGGKIAALAAGFVPVLGHAIALGIVVWIGHELLTFPRKLGHEVAKGIRGTLDGQFEKTTHDIADKIVATLEAELGKLAMAVVMDAGFLDSVLDSSETFQT